MKLILSKNDEFYEGLQFVSELIGVSEQDIMSKDRFRDAVIGRHFLRYYLRDKCNFTYQSIADLMDCNHASVIHSVNYVKDCVRYDKLYSLYKHSIDSGVLKTTTNVRLGISNILSSAKNNEFKCNAIISLVNEHFSESK
tara:strand:- start:1208 stop:1627 length:420 start_codon:yes stop_codon:yes gene_type:complete